MLKYRSSVFEVTTKEVELIYKLLLVKVCVKIYCIYVLCTMQQYICCTINNDKRGI